MKRAFPQTTFAAFIAVAMLAATAAGCGGPDRSEASKENFTRVIGEHLEEEGVCERMRRVRFPMVVKKSAFESESEEDRQVFARHVNAGVWVREDTVTASAGGSSREPVEAVKFSLTEKGRQYFKKKPAGPLRGEAWHLCYGTPRVTEVTGFTEPASHPMAGAKVSRVNYTYTVEDIPAWIKDGAAGRSVESVAYWMGGGEPKEEQATLVLSGDGWVHESAFSR